MSMHKSSIVRKEKYPNIYSAIGLLFSNQKLLENIIIRIQPLHMRQIEIELSRLSKYKKSFPNKEYAKFLKTKYNRILVDEENIEDSEFEVFVNPLDDQSLFLTEKYNIKRADKFLDDVWDGKCGSSFFVKEITPSFI